MGNNKKRNGNKNGAEESRTPDLNNANVAFYQTKLRPHKLHVKIVYFLMNFLVWRNEFKKTYTKKIFL